MMGVPPVLVEPVFKEATVEFIAKEIICCRRECPRAAAGRTSR